MDTPVTTRFRCPTCGGSDVEEVWENCTCVRLVDRFMQFEATGKPQAIGTGLLEDEHVDLGRLTEYRCVDCEFSVRTLKELKPYLK